MKIIIIAYKNKDIFYYLCSYIFGIILQLLNIYIVIQLLILCRSILYCFKTEFKGKSYFLINIILEMRFWKYGYGKVSNCISLI